MKKYPALVSLVAAVALLASCSSSSSVSAAALSEMAEGLENEGTTLNLEGNNAYAFESISALSMLPEVKNQITVDSKATYLKTLRMENGQESSSAASSSAETSSEAEEDPVLTTIKTYLPTIDAAMSNSSALTIDYSKTSDLTEYANLVTVAYIDFSGASKSFSLYYNTVEVSAAASSEASSTVSSQAASTANPGPAPTGATGVASSAAQTSTTQTPPAVPTGATNASSTTAASENTSTAASQTAPNVPEGGHQGPGGHNDDHGVPPDKTGATDPNGNHDSIGPHDGKEGYSGHFDDGHDEDGEDFKNVVSEIEGIVLLDGVKYQMAGRTVENTAGKKEVDFGFFYNSTDYLKVRQLYLGDIQMFKYTVFASDKVSYSYSLGLFAEGSKTSVTLKESKLGSNEMIRFTESDLSGRSIIKATYKQSGTEKEVFFFEKTTDASGTIVYTQISDPFKQLEDSSAAASA